MVWDCFAVTTQTWSFSLIFQFTNKSYILLDRQRLMLIHDINYVNVENEIEVYTNRELENVNFQKFFLN